MTAQREFLNAPAQPLEAGPAAPRRAARLLATSRAKRLAIEPAAPSTWRHPERPALVEAQDPLARIVADLDRSSGFGLEL